MDLPLHSNVHSQVNELGQYSGTVNVFFCDGKMYPNIIPNPFLTIIDDLLPCLATAAKRWKGRESGKKVGRGAANRTMTLQADRLVPMSCYSAVAMLNNVTHEYEPLFSNASSGRCVCNAPSLSHAILQCECIRISSPSHI